MALFLTPIFSQFVFRVPLIVSSFHVAVLANQSFDLSILTNIALGLQLWEQFYIVLGVFSSSFTDHPG